MRTFQAEETASAKALRKPCVTLKEQQKDHRAREDGIGRGGKGGDPAELRGAEWWVFWNQDQNPSFITGNGITLGRGCGSANVTGEGTERSYVPGVSRLESFSVPHVTCLSFSMATASSKGHGLAPGWCLPDVRGGDRRSRIHPMPDCPNSHFGEEAWGTRGGGQDHKQPEETALVRKPHPQAPPSASPMAQLPRGRMSGLLVSTTSCSAAWRPQEGFRAGGMMVTAAHSVHTVPS